MHVASNRLYTANGSGMEVFNIHDTNATTPVSESNYTDSQNEGSAAVAIDSSRVYVGTTLGVDIVSIINVTAPTYSNEYDANESNWIGGTTDIAVQGEYLYTAEQNGSVGIYKLSFPKQ